MKINKTQSGPFQAVQIGLLLAFFSVWDGHALAQSVPGTPPGAPAQTQVLNMREADIRAFISDVSMLTGKTFIVDPRVQGKVTVVSQEALGPDDAFALFLSTLRANGFTAVATADGTYRIIPEEGAAQDAAPMAGTLEGDQLVTEVIRLHNVDVSTALQMIQPLVNRQGRAVATRGTNALIIVDYASNVARIRQVIAGFDRDPSVTAVIPLRNTSADQIARAVTDLVRIQGDGGNPLTNFAAVPLDGTNTLIMRGPPELLARMQPLVERLDAEGASTADTRVVYLRHAAAEELLPILERVSALVRGAAPVSGPGEAPAAGGALGRASIGMHAGTNALIINAPPDVQQQLSEVIRQLDIARHQVLVEAIIVEVSDTAAKQLGVQYVLSGGRGSDIPFSVTNFPSDSSPNILAATGAVVVDQRTSGEDPDVLKALQGAAIDSLLGTAGFMGGFAGRGSDGTIFGVILNALKRDVSSNVLSTPSIMTMDNQSASILVGQEIPITTGEALGSNNTNPFRTIERKDVGVKLEVKPQINEGGAIKLFIKQEVSSIFGPISLQSGELITNKRQIETTVMVNDGQIIVLGGLIEEDEQLSVDKVPLLGDIPILGNLFKSTDRSRKRTNLMVFMRPTIVTGANDLRAVTDRKYNYIQGEQLQRSRTGESSLDRVINDLTGRAVAPQP
jgi:general secretion pathway protein D